MSEIRLKEDTAPGTPPAGLVSIYVKTDGKLYIKDDAGVETPVGSVESVNGYTGIVVLTKADIGLGNADNTSDVNKPVSTAQAAADSAVQAFSIQRANHTGTQLASTISDFNTTARGLLSGTAPVNYNSGSGAISIPKADSVTDGYLSAADFVIFSSSAGGDVAGPVSSTDNAIARFDLTTGKLIQNSVVTVDDTGILAGASISASSNTLTNIANTSISASAAIDYSKLSLSASIVNADINASAAIAYSKLALSNSIVNADINASAAIAYSKLNLSASIVNADINASAAIAYSKLNLSASIVNADVSASAAIDYSKLSLSASIVNADINASAAIAGSKINPDFGAQNIVTTGSGTFSGTFDLAQIATPSNPTASRNRIYPKSDGNFYKLNSSGTEVNIATGLRTIGLTIDGGGSAITTGVKGYIEVPYTGTITGWTILGDVSGSMVVDVWKDTYANYPPTVADTIAGTEKPTISAALTGQDLSLSTWTTSVTAGDIIGFNVDSCSTITRATLVIRILPS